MDYTTIFKEALGTFWRHKSLWLFGIVITMFGQGEYSFSVNYRESYPASQGGLPDMPGRDLLLRFFENPVPYIIGFSLVSLAFWIITSIISWWSHGALIHMVDDVDQKGSTSIQNGMNAGNQQVIPLTIVFLLFAIPKALLNLPAIAVGIWLFSQFFDIYKNMLLGKVPSPEEMQAVFQPLMSNIFLGFACLFPLICIGGISGWLLSLLNKVTARSVVLEKRSVLESIKRGWQITRGNLGYVLLNGIVLVLLSILFGWIAAIPALILWVPVARALLHQSWNTSTIVTAIVTGFYFLFVAIGLGGILTSFNSVLWTKLYKAMVAKEKIIISNSQAS